MAYVSDEHGFVFVHIPKCGGHGVYGLLQHHVVVGDTPVVGDLILREYPRAEMHSPAYVLRDWFRATGREWEAYKTFAIVRDPFERMLSLWWEIRRQTIPKRRSFYWNRVGAKWWARFDECVDVNDFIASGLADPDGPMPLLAPQWSYVSDEGEMILDRLFLLEHMSTEVPAYLGWDDPAPVIHERPDDPVSLTQDSVVYIRSAYSEDLGLVAALRRDHDLALRHR